MTSTMSLTQNKSSYPDYIYAVPVRKLTTADRRECAVSVLHHHNNSKQLSGAESSHPGNDD